MRNIIKFSIEKFKKTYLSKGRIFLHIFLFYVPFRSHQSSVIVVFLLCTLITCEDVAYFLSPQRRALCLCLLHWCFNLGFSKSWNWKTLLICEFAAWMTVNCDKLTLLWCPHLWTCYLEQKRSPERVLLYFITYKMPLFVGRTTILCIMKWKRMLPIKLWHSVSAEVLVQ